MFPGRIILRGYEFLTVAAGATLVLYMDRRKAGSVADRWILSGSGSSGVDIQSGCERKVKMVRSLRGNPGCICRYGMLCNSADQLQTA